jgi:hypothetical protein
MARIRTVKPSFFRHRRLYFAEVETGLPLRLAYIGLWTCADREGRFRWEPEELKLDCLPYDGVDFSRVLDALATHGFVVKYASRSREYGCIPSWRNHQVINNREAESSLPPPLNNVLEPVEQTKQNEHAAFDASLEDDASGTREARVTDVHKGKGREKEMEKEGRESARARGDDRQDALPLPSDWKLSDTDIELAKSLGLIANEIEVEAGQFADYYRARGERRVSWSAQWSSWCRRAAQKLGRSPSATGAPLINLIPCDEDSERGRAWDAHWMRTRRVRAPWRNGKWAFESLWPPQPEDLCDCSADADRDGKDVGGADLLVQSTESRIETSAPSRSVDGRLAQLRSGDEPAS